MNFLESVGHCSTANKPLKLRKSSSHPANTKFLSIARDLHRPVTVTVSDPRTPLRMPSPSECFQLVSCQFFGYTGEGPLPQFTPLSYTPDTQHPGQVKHRILVSGFLISCWVPLLLGWPLSHVAFSLGIVSLSNPFCLYLLNSKSSSAPSIVTFVRSKVSSCSLRRLFRQENTNNLIFSVTVDRSLSYSLKQ